MIFNKHANLKYKYGSRNFWHKRYFVYTVAKNKIEIAKYIRNQPEEDYAYDQLRFKEFAAKFTGSKNK